MFSIYTARDGDGRVSFVGSTQHFLRRSEEHLIPVWSCEEIIQVADLLNARLTEQRLISEIATASSTQNSDN